MPSYSNVTPNSDGSVYSGGVASGTAFIRRWRRFVALTCDR